MKIFFLFRRMLRFILLCPFMLLCLIFVAETFKDPWEIYMDSDFFSS
jgi:hypothetical protein